MPSASILLPVWVIVTLRSGAFPEAHIHKNISNISSYMQDADIAFTSAGRTTYELAILGTPAVVMGQNEREMTHFFASEEYGFKNLGLGVNVHADTILEEFKTLIAQPALRKEMQEKMLNNDLRSGKQRVIKIIKNLID